MQEIVIGARCSGRTRQLLEMHMRHPHSIMLVHDSNEVKRCQYELAKLPMPPFMTFERFRTKMFLIVSYHNAENQIRGLRPDVAVLIDNLEHYLAFALKAGVFAVSMELPAPAPPYHGQLASMASTSYTDPQLIQPQQNFDPKDVIDF